MAGKVFAGGLVGGRVATISSRVLNFGNTLFVFLVHVENAFSQEDLDSMMEK